MFVYWCDCLQGHEEIVWAVEVHGRRLFSASADKTIRVWDIDSRRCEHVLEDHTRPVLSLAISGNRLYSGSYDFTIKVGSNTAGPGWWRGPVTSSCHRGAAASARLHARLRAHKNSSSRVAKCTSSRALGVG